LYEKHEGIPMSRTFNSTIKNEDTEEREGHLIPRWMITDEEEEDNDDNLLDEICIDIDGGTEIKSI